MKNCWANTNQPVCGNLNAFCAEQKPGTLKMTFIVKKLLVLYALDTAHREKTN